MYDRFMRFQCNYIFLLLILLFVQGASIFAQMDALGEAEDEEGNPIPPKTAKVPEHLIFDPEAPMANFRFWIRPIVASSTVGDDDDEDEMAVLDYKRFPELYFITQGRMHAFQINSETSTTGYYTGPAPMAFYREDGLDELGNVKYKEVCSVTVVPGWRNVIITMRANSDGSRVSATAVDSSLDKLPKGTVSIVNYTPLPMKFAFGKENLFDVAAYGDVKVPLSLVPENNYVKVAAALKIKENWVPVYKTTWALRKDYRGIFLMKPDPGSNPPRLVRERIVLADFGVKADRPRRKMQESEYEDGGGDDD